MKKIIAIIVACAGVLLSSHADSNSNPGTNTMVTIKQGTNIFVTVIQGTNAMVTIQQGTNPVMTVVKGASPAAPAVVVKKPVWESTVTAGLTLTRGNSDLLLFTAKIQTQKKTELNQWLLGADATYGDDNGVNNADSLHGSAQYNQMFSDRFYGFANADALHDGIQDLQYRVALNPGAGYHFIKTKLTDLVGEVGPGLVNEKLADTDETYASLRLAEHFDQKLSESAKLWEKAELIPQVNKIDNYYLNTEVGVETAITKAFSLQITLDDAYVNEPAAGRKSNDVKLVSGISYKF